MAHMGYEETGKHENKCADAGGQSIQFERPHQTIHEQAGEKDVKNALVFYILELQKPVADKQGQRNIEGV